MKGRRTIAALAALATVGLTAPAAANAAAVAFSPVKSCYRSGEGLAFGGNGFTPNSSVSLFADGKQIEDRNTHQPARAPTDATGAFGPGTLTVAQPSGEKVKTYTATDDANPALTASAQVRVSAVSVQLRPKRGRPERRFRIRARGFTTGKRLYAHVVRKRFRRTVRIGRLKGACHTLRARKRLFSRTVAPGTYRIQFDSKRRFSRDTRVRFSVAFRVTRRIR